LGRSLQQYKWDELEIFRSTHKSWLKQLII